MNSIQRGYNLTKLDNVCSQILNVNKPSDSTLRELKKVLNSFFKGTECLEVFYTINTDKLFFGACVMPVLTSDETMEIVATDKKMEIHKYCLEIDSKITTIGLEPKELSAILLHEIGHIVIGDSPIKAVRANIDDYIAKNHEVYDLKSSAEYVELIKFGIIDTMRKVTSFLYKNNEEVTADAFVSMCGYGDYLISALRKISRNALNLTFGVTGNRLFILEWVLRLYKNVKINRIPALQTLRDSKSNTGSELTKKEIDDVITALKRINTDSNLNESAVLEGFFHNLKVNGLRKIENDLFEYRVRLKAAQTEDEAISILRAVSSKLSILNDYIAKNNLSDIDKKHYDDVIQQYLALRDDIANSKIYKRKHYGVWMDINQLPSEYQAQTMY